MKRAGYLFAILVFLPASLWAQSSHAASAKLPEFSGIWNLNMRESKIQTGRPSGLGQMVIAYDGKTWKLKHIRRNNDGLVSDTWDITLVVGSTTLHVEREEPLTFRSRIYRDGDAMVLLEYVRTDRGQTTRNTVRYTLENDGMTLVEDERSVSVLGTERNHWVLDRVPPGTAAPFSQSRDPDGSDTR
jgi:hypothetical protein